VTAEPRASAGALTLPGEPIERDVDLLQRLLAQRYSCRAYLPEQVPRHVIARILETAQRAPSWANMQPWQVIVTSGDATDRFRAALSAEAAAGLAEPDLPFPREYRSPYAERRRESAVGLFASVGALTRRQSLQQSAENFRLYGAPHAAVVTTDAGLGVYGAIDCGAYVATFTYAAQALGVASVAQAAIARYSAFIRRYFQLPDDRLVVCGIAFGYEDAAHRANSYRAGRVGIDDVVTWVDA
jgi:nitroreductase